MILFELRTACFAAALLFMLPAHGAEIAENKPVIINEEQALGVFFERNLDLIMAHFDIERGQAAQIIASAIPNPTVEANFYEINSMIWTKQVSPATGLSWPQGGFPAWSMRVEQLIITAGKRTLRMESSELGTRALEYDLRNVVRVLSNAVRRAYYDLLLAQKSAELAQNNSDRYRDIVKLNKTRLDVGDIAGIDFTRIEVEALKAQSDVDSTRAALARAKAELLLLLGWPENSINIEAADKWPVFNTEKSKKSQTELVNKALEERPDLIAAKVRVEQAEKNVELARRLVIPDVTLIGFYQKDPGNFYTSTGGVGFSFELPLFYRQQGEIATAGVEMNNARLFIRQSEQNIRGDVMKAQAAWISAEAITQRFEESVVNRIEMLRKAVELAYQKGAAGFLELIDAERNYKAMMQDYYNALANRSSARADLIMATGEEVYK
jgi:cobalt-zinc-cadmium efflux system outer membrane protein